MQSGRFEGGVDIDLFFCYFDLGWFFLLGGCARVS